MLYPVLALVASTSLALMLPLHRAIPLTCNRVVHRLRAFALSATALMLLWIVAGTHSLEALP
jgi:hypothetical protein